MSSSSNYVFNYYIWAVDKTGSKILLNLCLWIFLAQGMGAFAAPPHALIQGEEDPGMELRQAPVRGPAAIDQIRVFNLEPAPQEELTVMYCSFLADTSLLSNSQRRNSILYAGFFLDRKYNLKNQIFPFHTFW